MTTVTTDLDGTFGQHVHLLMWQRRLSQTQVAQSLGIAQSALSRSLRGERNWRLGEVLALSAILDMPVAELLAGVDVGRVGLEPTPGGVWVTQSAYAAAA